MKRLSPFFTLLLTVTLLGLVGWGTTQAQAAPPSTDLSVQGRSTLLNPITPVQPLTQPTRWSVATSPLTGRAEAFNLTAPAGSSAPYSQVSSTVFELSALEVSGLGNVGNAALEQELRADFRSLQGMGDSQSRTVSLDIAGVTPAGTEITTRWKEQAADKEAEVQLRQLLLAGGLRGPVQPSSPDSALAARYALLPASDLARLSLLDSAPYGTPLSAGERVTGTSKQALSPLFTALLNAVPALADWNLPTPSSSSLPPLTVTSERVYQGQNSRGDHLFQTQGKAQPWTYTLKGNGSNVTLEVPDMAQMSQAVYRADGLPGSAFEFSTLQLQVTAQHGAAQVRFAVQVRTTSALRPAGNPSGSPVSRLIRLPVGNG